MSRRDDEIRIYVEVKKGIVKTLRELTRLVVTERGRRQNKKETETEKQFHSER